MILSPCLWVESVDKHRVILIPSYNTVDFHRRDTVIRQATPDTVEDEIESMDCELQNPRNTQGIAKHCPEFTRQCL